MPHDELDELDQSSRHENRKEADAHCSAVSEVVPKIRCRKSTE